MQKQCYKLKNYKIRFKTSVILKIMYYKFKKMKIIIIN